MKSVGEALRQERIRRNLDLDKISQELKISSRMLEAIELEQFDKLPGGVFTKSFVRQYARLLGLDEEELAADVQRTIEPEPPQPQAAELSKLNPPKLAAPIALPKVEEWQSVGESTRWSAFLPSAVLVVVVMLLCSAVYAYWQRMHHPSTAHESAPPVAQSTPQTPPAPAPVAQPPVSEQTPVPDAGTTPANSQPAAPPQNSAERHLADAPPTATAPPANTSTAAPQAAGQVHVELRADEPVWVRAQADGKFVFAEVLPANQSRIVEANGSVLLRIGNAGGVTIALNGKNLGSLGAKGQVRTIQLTSGGFQIVAAPKSPGALDPL